MNSDEVLYKFKRKLTPKKISALLNGIVNDNNLYYQIKRKVKNKQAEKLVTKILTKLHNEYIRKHKTVYPHLQRGKY